MMSVSGIAVCLLLGVSVLSQEITAARGAEAPRVADNSPVTPPEHPLMPVIRWAEQGRPAIAAIKDYTAIMSKQENIGGVVQEAQMMEVKVRHEPFSVYVKVRFPQRLNGQQSIYIKGQNDGKAFAHGVGFQRTFGTQRLDPEGMFMMNGHKYPITEMGILNLLDKLLEVGRNDSKYDECTVTYTEGIVLWKDTPAMRECIRIDVKHPVPRPHFMFHIARIFVDKELNIPIHYDSFEWPRKEGETPKLIESYSYRNLKINVGLTDADFDHTNPAYAFP